MFWEKKTYESFFNSSVYVSILSGIHCQVILSSCRCCHRHCLLLADSPAYCACAKSNCTIAVAFLAMLGMAVCAEVKADAEEEAQIIRVVVASSQSRHLSFVCVVAK